MDCAFMHWCVQSYFICSQHILYAYIFCECNEKMTYINMLKYADIWHNALSALLAYIFHIKYAEIWPLGKWNCIGCLHYIYNSYNIWTYGRNMHIIYDFLMQWVQCSLHICFVKYIWQKYEFECNEIRNHTVYWLHKLSSTHNSQRIYSHIIYATVKCAFTI